MTGEQTAERSRAALDGLRVVDLSRVLAGPYCTQLLADHGADVVKVEPPAGDETRTWGPPFLGPGMSAYYNGLNRNKRNVVLDFRRSAHLEVLDRMLERADVLVENYKAGTLERWGFDDAMIRRRYPRLVHTRLTAFGSEGPLGGRPGYDAVLQAYGGLMSVNGEAGGGPLRLGAPIVDLVTGVFAFSGTLLALIERQRSGRGQLVDCALLDTAVSLLHPHSANWFASGVVPKRSGSAHPTIAPYDIFETSDGPIFLGVGNDRQFRNLVEALGRPQLADDERFATNEDRLHHSADLRRELEPLIGERDREELDRALLARGVPASPINDVEEALTDPQVRFRGMLAELDGYRGVGIPVKLERTPGAVRSAPREQGADNLEVLRELDFSAEQIDELLEARIAVGRTRGEGEAGDLARRGGCRNGSDSTQT